MTDRSYVEKAAQAGASKIQLLQDDPLRYMLRAVGAGMALTLVVFVFWVLKQNLHDISLGAVIASGFFGVGLAIIVGFALLQVYQRYWSRHRVAVVALCMLMVAQNVIYLGPKSVRSSWSALLLPTNCWQWSAARAGRCMCDVFPAPGSSPMPRSNSCWTCSRPIICCGHKMKRARTPAR